MIKQVSLRRIGGDPLQWHGSSDDGSSVYVLYRDGILAVYIDGLELLRLQSSLNTDDGILIAVQEVCLAQCPQYILGADAPQDWPLKDGDQ